MLVKRGFVAGLALLAMPAVAGAQSAQQNINLGATVDKFCRFDAAPVFSGALNVAVGSSTPSSSSVNIINSTNSLGTIQAAQFSMSIQAVCNWAAAVSLETVNGALA